MGLETVLESLSTKESTVNQHRSVQNMKRENVIPEYMRFKELWLIRKEIKTARDKNIIVRIEEIAFLLVTDFIFFNGFELFIVEFFETLISNPELVLDYENQSIKIKNNISIPVSKKTWKHIQHFISVKRKLNKAFDKPFKFIKFNKALKGMWKHLKELRAEAMPPEFSILLDNFSYLPNSLSDKFIEKVRSICSRDIQEIKAIIANIRNGQKSHQNYELYHLFEPIFIEMVKNDYSPTKIKNLAQCINYVYYFYDIYSSFKEISPADETGNEISPVDEIEMVIVDGILPLRGYRSFYKLVQSLDVQLDFSGSLPCPRKEITQELINHSQFRHNDFLSFNEVEKILAKDVPDQFFFYFCLMLFTGVRPSTPLNTDCYEFGYRNGDLSVKIYMSKTNQYAERNLDKLIPAQYLKRFKSLLKNGKYKKLVGNLNLDKLRRFFFNKFARHDIYVCRRTFVNHLVISFVQLRSKMKGTEINKTFDIQTYIGEAGARSLITTENDCEISSRLKHIILLVSEIMRYSPLSTVIILHYLNQQFALLINQRKTFRDYLCQN